MKTKKLEKKTVFIFKKNNLSNLTKEQMRRINGGDPTGGRLNLFQSDDDGGPSSRLCNDLKTQSI